MGPDWNAAVAHDGFHLARQQLFDIIRDVTVEQQVEDVLHQSEQRFRALVEASPDAITVADLEGKTTFANMRAAQLHGFSSVAELLKADARNLILAEDLDMMRAALRELLAGKRVTEFQCTFR